MPISATLVVSFALLATPASPGDVPAAEPTPTAPVAYHDDLAPWRPLVITLGVVAGVAAGGFGGYWVTHGLPHDCGGSVVCFGPELTGVPVGGVLGGLAGGVIAGVLTQSWTAAPVRSVTLVPTIGGGRETAGLHLLMTF